MSTLVAAMRELAGLFVDDGLLALGILAVIAVAGISATLIPTAPMLTGGVLLFGCLGVLFANVATARRR